MKTLTNKLGRWAGGNATPLSILAASLVIALAVVLAYAPEPLEHETALAACEMRTPKAVISCSATPNNSNGNTNTVTIDVSGRFSVQKGGSCTNDFCAELSAIATSGGVSITSGAGLGGKTIPINIGPIDSTRNSCFAGGNTPFSAKNNGATFDASGMAEGTRNVTVQVVDNLGGSNGINTWTCSFTVSRPAPVKYKLTITKNPNQGGTVTASGINCGSDCTQMYDENTSVTLNPGTAGGWQFDGWTGANPIDCADGNVTMKADRGCTANYSLIPVAECSDGSDNDGDGLTDYPSDPGCSSSGDDDETNTWRTLTVTKNGAGSGTVTGPDGRQGNGIDCGSNCAEDYNNGRAITLSAGPGGGSVFSGWSGACDGGGSVTMNADKNCTATFDIAAPGTGNIIVNSNTGTTWNLTGPEPQSEPSAIATRTYSNVALGSYTIYPADEDARACPAGYICPAAKSPAASQTLTDGNTITFDLTYTPVAACADCAQYISQNVPSTLDIDEVRTVTVTMKNTGTNTWITGGLYVLGTQNPGDNTTWGGRIPVPSAVSTDTEVTFSFNITAPSTPGAYNFQRRMLSVVTMGGSGWFGDFTPNVAIDVVDPALPECSDGVDNADADGFCDTPGATCTDGSTPGDPGCTDPSDDDERNVWPECNDNVDNDGDTLIDFDGAGGTADPGCDDADDNDERDSPPECSDGVDNDADGDIDFPADTGCDDGDDDDELNAPVFEEF